MDKVSIIIRCKNEERWIGHTIQSCLDLIKYPEIIVVDNNSQDASIKIAKNFAHDPLITNDRKYTELKVFNLDDYTPGKAINLGVKKAKNDFILIISSHCVLRLFNLEEIYKGLVENCCVFGNQNPYYFGKRINKRYIWSNFINERKINLYSNEESRYFMHNALSCFKKKTLEDKPFDENLQGKEDRYWAQDVIKDGEKILYDPNNLSCDHHYTPNGNTWKGIG